MSELNDVFGFPQEDGQEPDFDAIFGGGEPTEAPPIPVEEPKTTDIPAAEIPAADVPTAEPHPEESAAAPAKETAKPEAPKTTKKSQEQNQGARSGAGSVFRVQRSGGYAGAARTEYGGCTSGSGAGVPVR